MGSLRDELLKAKLVSQKQAKKAKREQQQKRKEQGVKKLESEMSQRQQVFEEQKMERARQDQEIELARQEARCETERYHRLKNIIESSSISHGSGGPFKFYFVAVNGRIPSMNVTAELRSDLVNGKIAIVEMPGLPGGDFKCISAEGAKKLQSESPELICFFNSKRF